MNNEIIKKNSILAIAFLSISMAFPRSFLEIKMMLILFIILHFPLVGNNGLKNVPKHVALFYGNLSFVGLLAILTGVIRGNSFDAIIDGAKLYILWSSLSLFLFAYLRKLNSLLIFHYSIIIAAIITSLINLTFISTQYLGLNIYSVAFVDEMLLKVGFHDGYVQLISHNVGMLLFLVPYLIAIMMQNESPWRKKKLIWFAIILSVIASILSGRRALWLVIIMTFFITFILEIITEISYKKKIKILMLKGGFLIVLMLIFIVIIISFEESISYIESAFSTEDERSIQKSYLVNGFASMPMIGSGFGGVIGYVRNEYSPWLFELSYHQMLFNFGILGFGCLFCLYIYLYAKAIFMARKTKNALKNNILGIMVGSFGLIVGSYSNPYLGSFDYILIIGILPFYISFISDKTNKI